MNSDFLPKKILVFHNDWFSTVMEGDSAAYFETPLAARDAVKARGYRFVKVEKDEHGRAVETFERKEDTHAATP
jgi:hypothetical protein